jgi:hypothetical protein
LDVNSAWGNFTRKVKKVRGTTEYVIMSDPNRPDTFMVKRRDGDMISRSYPGGEVMSIKFTRPVHTCTPGTKVAEPIKVKIQPLDEKEQDVGGSFEFPSMLQHKEIGLEKEVHAYIPALSMEWKSLRQAIIWGIVKARASISENGLGWFGEVLC